MLRRLPVPVVFDHMGRVRGSTGTDSPAFRSLLRLVRETDHCWVKICSWYRLSDQGAPYEDMRPYVEALIRARVERLLWGSNWPHPLLKGPPPDDAELLDQFQRWAGSEGKTILVDNPAKLYGFGERV
jgi:predicted TIM-barrel fold metal-dependent hydrolase